MYCSRNRFGEQLTPCPISVRLGLKGVPYTQEQSGTSVLGESARKQHF